MTPSALPAMVRAGGKWSLRAVSLRALIGRGGVRRGGFTLVEVALALAITVLVLAAIVPLSASLIERADEGAVADRLSAGVRLATAEAVRSGASVTLCVRERRNGTGRDLVLQFPQASGAALIDLGVELPGAWRFESAGEAEGTGSAEGNRSAPPEGGTQAEGVTLTPIGTAMPDGRFLALGVIATNGPVQTGAVKKPVVGGEEAGEAPTRLSVHVDALSGRVSVTAIKKETEGERPDEAPTALEADDAVRDRHAAPGGER